LSLTNPLTLEWLALERLETQRREVACERLCARIRLNEPRPNGWLERFTKGFRTRRAATGGDARVNARQK
jgi:hypothetical protein